MKKALLLSVFSVFAFVNSFSQDLSVKDKVTEVNGLILEHMPQLEEFMTDLETNKQELEERIIVLKYHRGNKEVNLACQMAVDRVNEYYTAVDNKIKEFEGVWFEQSRNLIDIYTHYGMLKESSGTDNELQEFADDHGRYLDQIDAVKNMLVAIYADMSYIKNNI